MRLPRVRFTVRRLMVVTAVVALAAYGAVLWRRSAEYRERADQFCPLTMSGNNAEERVWLERRWLMFYKYDRAARYPFLPVAPDPPQPE